MRIEPTCAVSFCTRHSMALQPPHKGRREGEQGVWGLPYATTGTSSRAGPPTMVSLLTREEPGTTARPRAGSSPRPPHKRPSQDLQPFTAKGSHLPQPFTSRNSNNPLITTWKNTVSEKKKKKNHQPFPSSPTQPAPPTAAYPSCLILLLSAAPICALEG